jgi:hypothetical protein
MFSRNISLRIRKTHRYLGLLIGIQFLAWTVSGLYFSWTNLDEIHGDQFLNPKVETDAFQNLLPLDSIPNSIEKIHLVSLDKQPYYWINESHLYNARSGIIKNQITRNGGCGCCQETLDSRFGS